MEFSKDFRTDDNWEGIYNEWQLRGHLERMEFKKEFRTDDNWEGIYNGWQLGRNLQQADYGEDGYNLDADLQPVVPKLLLRVLVSQQGYHGTYRGGGIVLDDRIRRPGGRGI